MIINRRKSAGFLLVILAMLMLSSSCYGGTGGTGTLEGRVTIGPLQPVERPGVNPPVPPEVFQGRKVMVYDEAGKNLIQEVSIEQIDQTSTGQYNVTLKAGKYTVDISPKAGIGGSMDVPRVIEILPGQTVTLNIDIDTGIR